MVELKPILTDIYICVCEVFFVVVVFLFIAGTAFLMVDPQDLPEPSEESGVFERIKTFVQVHRNCFLLLRSPFKGKKELETLTVIQNR